jgi:peptide/nickel transport system substrate-binding protein
LAGPRHQTTLYITTLHARVDARAGRSPLGSNTLLSLVVAAASLTACSQANTTPAADPVTLRLGVSAPRAEAAEDLGLPNLVRGYLTSEPLVGIGWDGRPTPRLFSSWEWSENRLALRAKLQPKLKYHDGLPIDAALAADALHKAVKDPRSRTTAVSYSSVTSVQAEDSDTLVITLSRPEAFLLSDLASSTFTHPSGNRDIGVGPYRLLEWEPKPRLAAFEDYYRGRPRIDFIEVELFQEQRSAWAALMRGQLEAVHEITPSALEFVEGQTTVRTYPVVRPYYLALFFNTRHPILAKPAVRKALSEAVNREEFVAQGLSGNAVVAEGPIWPYHWAYSTAKKTSSQNTDAATLRLDGAGLKVRPATHPGGMASRFKFKCITLANDARFEKIAMVMQKQLYDIGVEMEIEPLSGKDLVARVGRGQFEAVLIERASGRSLNWAYLTFHSKLAPFGYTTADPVLERLRIATDENEIRTAASDLQRVLHDDPPAIFLVWPKIARAVSSSFEVPLPDEPGKEVRDIMGSLWQWRPRQRGSEK